MRLGVIDVGSNTVHLLVVDAHRGARPLPASSHKIELRLTEHLDEHGHIRPDGVEALTAFIAECVQIGEDLGVEETVGFATSAVREAGNGEELLAVVRERTGVDLRVLGGGDEAALTFLAVRRWFGWSAGRLLVLDIGGGSLEIAAGMDELADVSLSLPLGAGRLTRDLLPGDPPDADDVRAARRRIRAEVARAVPEVSRAGAADRVVGTSKTFRSLARICGAAPSTSGVHEERWLERAQLSKMLPELTGMSCRQRAELPGVAPGRAPQLLAGALVAEAAMELLGVERLQICPWALREGLLLRRLDRMASGTR